MEKIKALDSEKLAEITKSGRVVLEWSADWCPDCRFLDPALPAIEQDFPNSKFYQIDRDGSMDLAKELKILGYPKFLSSTKMGKKLVDWLIKIEKLRTKLKRF
jgi:thiol-disulfide isomerase/thioredoxin